LGSGKGRVIWLILHEAALLSAAGLGFGLAGAGIVGRTMRSTLYGVGSIDLWVLLSVAVILFLTALLASYLPARRAAIEPMQALRNQ
jgi:ABC-type antimicrobial peptide transport system permease subunit